MGAMRRMEKNRSALNRDSKVPLYKQLYLELKRKIVDGAVKSGETFYSEYELIKMYGVSRITVRSALYMLEKEGYIKKSQGSVPIVVDQSKITWNLSDITHDLRNFKDDLITEIRAIDRVEPSKRIMEKLQLNESTDFVYRIDRIRKIREKKMARSISYLIPSLPIDIHNVEFDDHYSITELLRQMGKNPLYCEETIEAMNADKLTCQLLGLPENAAVFFRERITFDENDIPLEYVESYYNSKYIKYYVKNELL